MENGNKQESADDIYWSTLHEAGDFSRQVEVLLHTVRMPRATVKQFRVLLDDLRLQLLKIWPDVKITTFGSTATGLALKSSDIDIFITFPGTATTSTVETFDEPSVETQQMLVKQAAETLKQNGTFTHVKTLNLPLPILIFTHEPTKLKCDAKFRIDRNEKETQIIRYFISLDIRVLPLMIMVKYWSNLHGLSIQYKMPNIVWISLVVFYLQQVDILPSIHSLQKSAEPKIENYWNYSFEESFEYLYYSKNNDSLYELLGGFFKYYANFDFENNVISIFAGTAVRCELFSNIEEVPEIFELYKSNVINNLVSPLDTGGALCLHRLFEHNNNMADEKISHIQLAAVIFHFKNAYKYFRKSGEKYFFKLIMTPVLSKQRYF